MKNLFLTVWAVLATSLGIFLTHLRSDWEVLKAGGRTRRRLLRAACLLVGIAGCTVLCTCLDGWHIADPTFGSASAQRALHSPATGIGLALLLVGVFGSLIPPAARPNSVPTLKSSHRLEPSAAIVARQARA